MPKIIIRVSLVALGLVVMTAISLKIRFDVAQECERLCGTGPSISFSKISLSSLHFLRVSFDVTGDENTSSLEWHAHPFAEIEGYK